MNSTGYKLFSVVLCILSGATGWADDRVKFNRDIRPILSDNCFPCHGPDAKQRQAGLRLDVGEEALKGAESGDVAIVPGDLNKSRLWARINSADAAEVMPPPKTSKSLTAAQKGKLRQWIEQGATYEPHWSFLPPASGAMPTVKRGDWSRSDLDRFILARLESEGLAPSPEVAKVTLIRRVSLDLTGLPPTLAEVDTFLAVGDAASDATLKPGELAPFTAIASTLLNLDEVITKE